jgi:hypothetical protein
LSSNDSSEKDEKRQIKQKHPLNKESINLRSFKQENNPKNIPVNLPDKFLERNAQNMDQNNQEKILFKMNIKKFRSC